MRVRYEETAVGAGHQLTDARPFCCWSTLNLLVATLQPSDRRHNSFESGQNHICVRIATASNLAPVSWKSSGLACLLMTPCR